MRPLKVLNDRVAVEILDQTELPHSEVYRVIDSLEAAATAIESMAVRGAPLIGIMAAYGLWLGLHHDPSDGGVERGCRRLARTRPTAVNLSWSLARLRRIIEAVSEPERAAVARREADRLAAVEIAACRAIGEYGVELLREIHRRKPSGEPVRVLTHCNAGWLATLEYGTALAPVYLAHQLGIPVQVWADETRPRNQGWLTAWELDRGGVPCTVVADNASGHLLQRGAVDIVLVGTDRTTANGDVCNKIGTWLKALAAHDSGVPFWAAVPSSSIDWTVTDWRDIPIEERGGGELLRVTGRAASGAVASVAVGADATPVCNPAFDVTPAALVTGLITERGLCDASARGLAQLFPDWAPPLPNTAVSGDNC